MGAAIAFREEYDAETLRRLAARAKDPNQALWLLSLAAIRGGKTRGEAARIGGMDRQTLRDWVIAFNAQGPEGLIHAKPPGRQPKLTTEHKATLKTLVEQGPDPERDGVVRWRCTDLQQVIKDRFAVEVDAVTVGRVLKALGFAHISARAQHPAQDPAAIAAFKKLRRARGGGGEGCAGRTADRGVVSGRDAGRPEERSGLPVGGEGNPPAPAAGPALCQC